MKDVKYLIIFIGIILIFIPGCSDPKDSKDTLENKEQIIIVQKRIGDEDKYEEFKDITDKEQVQKVNEILVDINWINDETQKMHPTDYMFYFRFKNPNYKAKPILYEIWIHPNEDKIELFTSGKMVLLDKNQSSKLFEILTGGKLTNIK